MLRKHWHRPSHRYLLSSDLPSAWAMVLVMSDPCDVQLVWILRVNVCSETSSAVVALPTIQLWKKFVFQFLQAQVRGCNWQKQCMIVSWANSTRYISVHWGVDDIPMSLGETNSDLAV